MRIEDMIIVSVDDHVVEPPHVFTHHLDPKYSDIAPRVERTPDGKDVWQFFDDVIPNIGLNAVAGRPKEEYGIEPTSFDELRPGCYDMAARVMDMNANGLLGSLNFPSLPGFAGRLFMPLAERDESAALAMVRAYNDWHVDEWCAYAPDRFIPCGIPAIWSAEHSAAEVRRLAAKGVHAVTFAENTVPLGLPSLHSEFWDPFWAACAETATTVCMHIGSSSKLAVTAPDAPIDVMIALQPMNIVQAAADIIHAPMFKKFPDLRIALSEGGIGWIPYFLERIDHSYRTHKAWTGADFGSKLPSEVFMEHVYLCFISDPVGVRHAREIGVDHICVEVDYPHSDTTWPTAPERLAQELAATDLTDDEVDAISYRSACTAFSFDPFSMRPKEQCTVGARRADAADWDVSIVAKGGAKPAPAGGISISELNPTV
ncbi:MAG: amidohydrolase family protein [Acidimicrobiia bacterium]